MKRPGIPWENYCMQKHGGSIRRKILDLAVEIIMKSRRYEREKPEEVAEKPLWVSQEVGHV